MKVSSGLRSACSRPCVESTHRSTSLTICSWTGGLHEFLFSKRPPEKLPCRPRPLCATDARRDASAKPRVRVLGVPVPPHHEHNAGFWPNCSSYLFRLCFVSSSAAGSQQHPTGPAPKRVWASRHGNSHKRCRSPSASNMSAKKRLGQSWEQDMGDFDIESAVNGVSTPKGKPQKKVQYHRLLCRVDLSACHV